MKRLAPGGHNLRDLIETALAGSAVPEVRPAANTDFEERTAEAQSAVIRGSTVVVGEVLDTHHPHLPGRVLVRWLDEHGVITERWLQRERHLSLRTSDPVLVTLPAGWSEWIVTGVLGRESRPPVEDDHVSTLRLEPGQVLRILSHEGSTLMTLRQGEEGPVVELGRGNVEIAASRTLRLRADTVEIAGGAGGVDLRTDGEAVVRARTIRLN
ncbi:MAG: hypothetical protein JW940_18515 [Polyangiaceae bacterium]|nr:hypothetical protein [Polyangiaceae bacterium]